MTSIAQAHKQIQIIRDIVRRERKRAEGAPDDKRYVEMGIVEENASHQNTKKKQIAAAFNEIEILIDHLHVSHIAAAFESAARPKLSNAIGSVRSQQSSSAYVWRKNLVKSQEDFGSLASIGSCLDCNTAQKKAYNTIKDIRNRLDHGEKPSIAPSIGADEARLVLEVLLEGIM